MADVDEVITIAFTSKNLINVYQNEPSIWKKLGTQSKGGGQGTGVATYCRHLLPQVTHQTVVLPIFCPITQTSSHPTRMTASLCLFDTHNLTHCRNVWWNVQNQHCIFNVVWNFWIFKFWVGHFYFIFKMFLLIMARYYVTSRHIFNIIN